MQREKGTVNNGLRKHNEDIKQDTINKVTEAIIVLQEERSVVTYKKLVEITGLCRATFYADHVIAVLEKYKVCEYKDSKKISADNPKSYLKHLEKECERLVKENEKLFKDLTKSRETTDDLIMELSKKEKLIKLYLGKIDELQNKIINKNPTL